ncbi:hypothetical protein SASPL_108800 [Salvia splendens]|uniref:DUF7870 domain-containing protein n=1 Tax=Salvia splendens TaxID=180675 RepID=A0A8X8YJH1_SALSN|nr:hypothetical protein SASPL_108800 [Salvia splendens]
MEPNFGKPSFLRNILVRLFLFCVFVIALRSAYVVTIRGESCDVADFCFFALPANIDVGEVVTKSGAISKQKKIPDLWATGGFQKSVQFYSSVFQDLMSEAVLSPNFKTLCVDTPTGADVFALRELGVEDSIGISRKGFKPLVVPGQGLKQPFSDSIFDFVFCGGGAVEKSTKLADFAAETQRTMRPDGFLVVHTLANDTYSFESLLGLFNSCKLVRSRDIDGLNYKLPFIREVVLQKFGGQEEFMEKKSRGVSAEKCSVPSYKKDLIKKAEALIEEEPLKPWITLKRNAQKIKYLASMVDLSFKPRYVYVDVGARSYGSSIVSWFKKQYPKQNKTFEIYAIEADKTFHGDYKLKKGVTLLPYAAWVRNESLFFEINGRESVTESDYVVIKMDVEGTEFELIPRLFKTGAICLIDELFLECHYNRWQKCCPGERSAKYERTYRQCLDLFTSLRKNGVLVHQWW